MKKVVSLWAFLIQTCVIFAQPNCEAYKYAGDSLKYGACQKAMEISGLYQFSKEYQLLLDEALKIDSTFDYAYWAKSIAYLKSGDFITWKKLIDKAVEYNPAEHLGYRGWCRYQFFADYEGAIEDIEHLDSLVSHDIGYSQNGTYHLNFAKGLWYRELGEYEKALEILEEQIRKNEQDEYVGKFDYVHLGALYLKLNRPANALKTLSKQANIYPLAEAEYYSALAYLKLNEPKKFEKKLQAALKLYQDKQTMIDTYSTPMDKIYLVDIETQLAKANLLNSSAD